MTARTDRRKLALSFPPGFIKLVNNGRVRSSGVDVELAAAYPNLSRLERELVLAMVARPEIVERLGATSAGHQVAFAVVHTDDQLAGLVLLAAAAARLPEWWSAESLEDELSMGLSGRTDVEIERLPVRAVAAVLVRHPAESHWLEPPFDELTRYDQRRADLYLAHPSCGSDLVVISCISMGTADSAVTELLRSIAATARAV